MSLSSSLRPPSRNRKRGLWERNAAVSSLANIRKNESWAAASALSSLRQGNRVRWANQHGGGSLRHVRTFEQHPLESVYKKAEMMWATIKKFITKLLPNGGAILEKLDSMPAHLSEEFRTIETLGNVAAWTRGMIATPIPDRMKNVFDDVRSKCLDIIERAIQAVDNDPAYQNAVRVLDRYWQTGMHGPPQNSQSNSIMSNSNSS